MIRSLIREFLLQEEVFGAQAFVYHGSKAPPKVLLPAFLEDKFVPGKGVGSMYGKGLYAVYDLPGSKTESGKTYGKYIYKLKVNLYGFISFDPDVTKKIYKKDLSLSQQAELVGADKEIIEKLKRFDNKQVPEFSSDWADRASEYLKGKVKGLVYTGRNDGRCIVLYDVSVAVPTAWKTVNDRAWTKVDRESLKPSLRRSLTGGWEKERYDVDPRTVVNSLKKLPIEKRILKGNLNLSGEDIKFLPTGLQVEGDLDLSFTDIQSLPSGLKVKGNLNLYKSSIHYLTADLQVGGDIDLSYTDIQSLPNNLKIKGNLNLEHSSITSLPTGLKVGGDLELGQSQITSLSNDLQVKGSLLLARAVRIASLPTGLKVGGDLYLTNSSITSLPAGLKVGGDLYLSNTSITSLPDDLKVGGSLDLEHSSITSVPASVKVGGKIIGLR